MALLRNFLYLDERLTSQSLAQLEGGVYEEEAQTVTAARARGGEAGAKAGPLTAKGSRGSTAEESASKTMVQTPEGDFRRLERLLEEQDGLQWLDAFDDAIWKSLARGEALRVESVVKVSSVYQATELASSVGPLLGLMESLARGWTTRRRQRSPA